MKYPKNESLIDLRILHTQLIHILHLFTIIIFFFTNPKKEESKGFISGERGDRGIAPLPFLSKKE